MTRTPIYTLRGFKLGAFRILLTGTLGECIAEQKRREAAGWTECTITLDSIRDDDTPDGTARYTIC